MRAKAKRHRKWIRKDGVTYYHRGGDQYRSDGGDLLERTIIHLILSGGDTHGYEVSSELSPHGGEVSARQDSGGMQGFE